MNLSFEVRDVEHLRIVLRERYLLQWHQNNAVLGAIVVAQLEFAFGEFGIPANTAE